MSDPTLRLRPNGWMSVLTSRERTVWWISFGVLGLALSLYSFALPIMSAPDEVAHTIKAVAVARGELRYHYTRQATEGGSYPVTLEQVPDGYSQLRVLQACWTQPVEEGNACARLHQLRGTAGGATTTVSTQFGSYPPAYYAIVGLPSLVLDPATALYAMRLVSALLCAAMLASALTSALAASRGGFLFLAVGLGLTPTAMILCATVNPNGLEIAAALAVWLSLLDLLTRDGVPGRLLVRVAVCTVLLVTCRPASPEIFAAIVVLVALVAGTRTRTRQLWEDRRARLAGAVMGVATLLSVGFGLVAHTSTALIGFTPASGSKLTVAKTSFQATITHVREMFATTRLVATDTQDPHHSLLLHLVAVKPPGFLVPVWVGVILLLALAGLVLGGWRPRLAIAGLLVATVGAGVLAEVLTASTYGYGWQGRYALPLVVGIPVLGAWVVERSGTLSPRTQRNIGSAGGVAIAAAYVINQLALMSFNLHDDQVPWWRGALSGAWIGPGTPGLLVTWAVVAGVAYGGWLVALTRSDRSPLGVDQAFDRPGPPTSELTPAAEPT